MVLEQLGNAMTNIDLSGVSGYIHYTYDNSAQYIPAVIISLGVLFFISLFGIAIMSMCSTPKTEKYREELVDMYVAATTRKLAKEDGLDLAEEYRTFLKDDKMKKLKFKGLSAAIEDELKEKVSLKEEKAISKVIKKNK